eukprot:gene21514-biopygen7413
MQSNLVPGTRPRPTHSATRIELKPKLPIQRLDADDEHDGLRENKENKVKMNDGHFRFQLDSGREHSLREVSWYWYQ